MTDTLLTILDADRSQFADYASILTIAQDAERSGLASDARIGQAVAELMRQAREDADRRRQRKEQNPDTGDLFTEYDVQVAVKSAVKTLAKDVNHSLSWAYDRGDLYRFYGARALSLFYGQPVGKEHLLKVMRSIRKAFPDTPPDEQAACAVNFISDVVIERQATVPETSKLLADTFGGKLPTSIRFAGRVVADDDGELWIQPLETVKGLQVGKVYSFTAKEEKG